MQMTVQQRQLLLKQNNEIIRANTKLCTTVRRLNQDIIELKVRKIMVITG